MSKALKPAVSLRQSLQTRVGLLVCSAVLLMGLGALLFGLKPMVERIAADQFSVASAQVEAKHDQAERIEDRLEDLIERQESRMQQAQAKQPGMLALPSTRAKWQQQMQQQQATLQRLHGRLETVREIKEGMGIHSPRIEELAARKLRAQEPELASEWADMREAQRRPEALQRKEEQEKKQTQDRERREQIERTGRGVRLGLSQAR